MDKALEAGADDVVEDDNVFQVVTAPDDFETVREGLEAEGIKFLEASVAMIPQNVVDITEEKPAKQILRLLESLEEHDDVQNVFSNFDISDEVMQLVS